MQSLQAPTDIVVSDSDGLTRYAVKRTRRQIVSFLLLLFPILLSCYTITLNLDLDETGQGVAWLYFEYYVGDDQEVNYDDINASLAQKGWTTQPPSVLGNGRALSSAYRNFSADQPLDDLIRSVPGFENSASTMQLIVEKDEVLEIYQYTFQTKLVMTEHVNNWLALEEAAEEGIKTSCTGLPLVGADEDCTIEFTPQEIQQILDETGPITFVLDIDLPGSLETTNGPWTDTQKLIMNWEADSGADPVNLRAVSIQHPDNEPVSPETLERDVGTLVDRFTVELGNGQIVSNPSLMQNYLTALFSPGKANNMTNGTLYACGWWQGKVVDWLDGIRLSSNADERALLAGLDYGPIQAYYGGHQAVVLYPKGTNWQETGIVLDPWPEQIPQNFTMEQWKAKFGIGSTFGASYGIEPGQRDQDYPHLNGGPSHYPDTLTQDARLHFRRVLVNSPVDVLVTRSDGARIGILPDGTIVNEIPGADFYPPSDSEDEKQWYFGLPDADYSMQITGTDNGDMHVLVAGAGDQLVTYGAQPIGSQEQSSINFAPFLPLEQPMVRDSGEQVTPWLATEAALHDIYGDQDSAASSDDWKWILGIFGGLGVLAVFCGLPLLGLFGYWIWRRRRA